MKKLKRIYIEITNVCNLACHFCPPTERVASFIQPEQFSHMLDEIKPYTDHIYLHVKGEPLMHPKLDVLMDISHAKGFRVNLTTNGTLIRKAGPKLLGKPALRQINFSLHSFDGHPGSENREQYLSDIFAFVREIRNQPVYVSFRLWNLRQDNAMNAALQRNRETLAMIEREFGLDYRIEERLDPGGGIKIEERIYVNFDYEFDWPSLSAPEDDGVGFCHALRQHAAILTDGTVVPCCLDGNGIIRLGNVHQESFGQILAGERARRIVEGFSRRRAVEELCRKCGYRKRFGGN